VIVWLDLGQRKLDDLLRRVHGEGVLNTPSKRRKHIELVFRPDGRQHIVMLVEHGLVILNEIRF